MSELDQVKLIQKGNKEFYEKTVVPALQSIQEYQRLEQENKKLRGLLAKGDADCLYCGLPKKDMAKCSHGFPGCGRADDLMDGE